jgi:hypothetical protein
MLSRGVLRWTSYGLHPEAYDDIDAIREYITGDNPDATDRVVTEILLTPEAQDV